VLVAAMDSDRPLLDPSSLRRFLAALAACVALPSIVLAATVIVIDPYYVFGSPDWRGVNVVRPQYETHVIVAKPYQVARMRPEGVAFGSSTAEVGIDPRHPGWNSTRVFNFALPSSNSHAVMLAFLHAQSHGMKRAVIGLDFFAYNIFGPLALDIREDRFITPATSEEFADLLATKPAAGTLSAVVSLSPGEIWNEAAYLQAHPDVASAVRAGDFKSGYDHYQRAGRTERRWGGILPPDWDDARYLARNPAARARVALYGYANGYVHYFLYGNSQGMLGGFPAKDAPEEIELAWPALSRAVVVAGEMFRLIFSTTVADDVVTTVRNQDQPASFDDLGMRVWRGHDAAIMSFGGPGRMLDRRLQDGRWAPWLFAPRFMFCFAYQAGGVSTFDPYRFMLRKAYAGGLDVHLFTTPMHAVIRQVFDDMGLGERYEYWLKELTSINEQEAARAGRTPFPLWDFSDANTVTREPFPVANDPSLMRWFWEYSHYRKEAGDLVLDRMFGYQAAGRTVPPDFGVKLTGENIEDHLTRGRARQADWGKAEGAMQEKIRRFVRAPHTSNNQPDATCW